MKNILSALSQFIRSARPLSRWNGEGHSSYARRIGSTLVALTVLLLATVAPAGAADVVWVEDVTPPGAALSGTWSWISANPAPYSGSVAHRSTLATGTHQHYFQNASTSARLSVNAGDTLFAYVYLDPANPPSQVMLQWNDGNWEHRAYWGANSIGWGVNGTNSRRYMGALPPLGQWVRLEVPASLVGLEGRVLNGMAFTLYSGRATWDRAGKLYVAANLPPMVNFNEPANNSTYSAPAAITLTATATDSDGTIANVGFYNGDALIGAGTLTGGSYRFGWSNVAAGSYSLSVRATDNLGAVGGSAPVNITVTAPTNAAPTVSITAPVNGATYIAPAAISLGANAADSDGTISKVEFYNGATLLGTDTSSPYTLSLSNVAAGSYAYTAKAYDNAGSITTSAAVNVTVAAANVIPTVSMTSPVGGSTYTAPASLTLAATAADSDGSVAGVAFYNGATLIGTGTLAGGSYTFASSNVAAGSYSVTARATDNQGASADSAPVAVTVTAPAPPPVAAGVYYIYADHLNTPRVITDTTNKIVWRWDSGPFGADAANEDPDGNGQTFRYNLRFPGQYYDRETGLHYNYFRDYEPGTGRYVQSDPIGLAGGLNLYSYANQNPLTFIDPTGEVSGPAIAIAIIIAGGTYKWLNFEKCVEGCEKTNTQCNVDGNTKPNMDCRRLCLIEEFYGQKPRLGREQNHDYEFKQRHHESSYCGIPVLNRSSGPKFGGHVCNRIVRAGRG